MQLGGWPVLVAMALQMWTAPISFGQVPSTAPRTGQQSNAAVPERESKKYERFFYPHGLPLRDNDYTGGQEKPSYKFYSDLLIPDTDLVVVLFSERLETRQNADKLYWIHLGVLRRTQNVFSVVQDLDVTDSSPIFTEQPGNFLAMDGKLSKFPLHNAVSVIHLNLWSTLFGTAAASAASDLFYVLQYDGRLQPVLEIKETSTSGRITAGTQYKGSKIWAQDIDGDGTTEIILQSFNVQETDGKSNITKGKPIVYKFENNKYVENGSVPSDTFTQKVENSEVLPTVKEVKAPE